MKILLVVLMFLLAGLPYGECPFMAPCPYDGENSLQTGNGKFTPNGCLVREYGHRGSYDGKRPGHKFWQACDCK
jgi:hypothetical protein